MTDTPKPLHIIELRSSNVKRLRAVHIRPDPKGGLVIIAGANGAGKSSCLDSISLALGGARDIPLEPIRHGAKKAAVLVDLGDIQVVRTFSAKGSELVIRSKDGEPVASPQKLLDSLCSKVCFDPFEFSRMEPKKQDEILRKLVGLDLAAETAALKKLYDQRAEINRDHKKAEALASAMPFHEDAPDKPVDVSALVTELETVAKINREIAVDAKVVADRERDLAHLRSLVDDAVSERASLQAQFDRLDSAIVTRRAECVKRGADIDDQKTKLRPVLDDAPIREKLKSAEAMNAKVRANQAMRAKEREVAELYTMSKDMTETMQSIEEEKTAKISAAKFPIDGLSFDDSGPLFNTVPLAQSSAAERLRVSVAIGAALNPRVRVALVRDGSLLDDESMRLLAELAAEKDLQIWVERVSTKDPGCIIISDGAVLDAAEDAGESTTEPAAADGAGI